MRPLKIRAHLVNGIAVKDPWSPAIDGILAAVTMCRRLGPDLFRTPQPSALEPVTGLPLFVCRHGDLWWYAASSPIAIDVVGREKKAFHRRFDDQHERYLADGVRKVMTAAGPYKATRLFDTRIICRAVDWHVVGDEAAIHDLLSDVDQIGAKRGTGFGLVRRWEITDGDEHTALTHRPLPVVAVGEPAGRMVMPWGIVPPGRLSPVECVMPGGRDAAA